MRDNNSMARLGWILAFETGGGRLAYRLGGTHVHHRPDRSPICAGRLAPLRRSPRTAATSRSTSTATPCHSAEHRRNRAPARLARHAQRQLRHRVHAGRADEVAVYSTALSPPTSHATTRRALAVESEVSDIELFATRARPRSETHASANVRSATRRSVDNVDRGRRRPPALLADGPANPRRPGGARSWNGCAAGPQRPPAGRADRARCPSAARGR